MTAAEAIRAYGLDWQVGLTPVVATHPEWGISAVVPRAQAVVRRDTGASLSVVGARFQPIQNTRAFSFFDHLVTAQGAVYESAGSSDGGKRVWIQARLPGDRWITSEDPVESYLLLTMLHGGGSLEVLLTPRRVLCKNMLVSILRDGRERAIRIRHIGDIEHQVRQAEELFERSLSGFDRFTEEAQAFARRSLQTEEVGRYFRTLVPDPEDASPTRAAATRETLVRLFETGRGNALPSVRGTLWAAVNGVVEFVDHERPTRPGDGETERASRFRSAQFGTGHTLKARAWREALALLG
jgi:phage/plasmid-like protein (TIGR03299 family)